MQDTKHIFGRRLRVLRKSRQWTLEELGQKAELGYKHVADIERGIKAPSFEAIDRLATALDVKPYELFLPSPLPDSDPDMRLGDLVREIERFGSASLKRFLLELWDSARNFHSASSTGQGKLDADRPRRAKTRDQKKG